jgi:hypothetical protein
VADMVAFCAGTHSSSAAARQCGSNHNRWRKTLYQDLGDDERTCRLPWALIKIL